MAFLIASPWNSFSLTLILWGLVGFWWMLAFLVLSLVVAIISGVIFEHLVARKTLPKNPNAIALPTDFHFWKNARTGIRTTKFTPHFFGEILRDGFRGSIPILRWIFFGVVIAALLRVFLSADMMSTYFGPTLAGLGLTIFVATVMEVCSEGSVPIAADIFLRGRAAGNTFAFLMTGVSTDYTEIAALRETTRSWKIAFFLPLVTLPQVIFLGWILNQVN